MSDIERIAANAWKLTAPSAERTTLNQLDVKVVLTDSDECQYEIAIAFTRDTGDTRAMRIANLIMAVRNLL